MKPRIKRGQWGWVCSDGKWTAQGGTPMSAYQIWRHYRKMGRLNSINWIVFRRKQEEKRVAERQKRIKDAQRKLAEVVEITPAPCAFKRFLMFFAVGCVRLDEGIK